MSSPTRRLTVWDPNSTATYLFETHTLTSAAWNDYGGYSFYIGVGACPAGAPSYPTCNRARISSLDRPFVDGNGSGDFLYNELPLLQFMEQHGLDVGYVNDVLLDSHPEVMLNHKAFLSLGHDETWTYAERKGIEAAAAKGVNVAFLSAAAMVRHARLQPSSIGPDREVVEYRDASEDPDKDPKNNTGNTWAVPPASWPVNSFIGQQYSGYLHPETPECRLRRLRRIGLDLQRHRAQERVVDPGRHRIRYRPPRHRDDAGKYPGARSFADLAERRADQSGQVGELHLLRYDLLHRSEKQGRHLRQRRGQLDRVP